MSLFLSFQAEDFIPQKKSDNVGRSSLPLFLGAIGNASVCLLYQRAARRALGYEPRYEVVHSIFCLML